MALVINDRVKVTSTTTGTGAFALGAAVTGFETFAQGIGNNNTTYYCISWCSWIRKRNSKSTIRCCLVSTKI